MKAIRITCFSLLFVLFSASSQADQYLWNDRDDQNVPVHCRDFEIRRFATVQRTVVFGIQGSKSAGFTHEIDIQRGNANLIWNSLKPGGSPIQSTDVDLLETARLIRDHGRVMGFDFKKEGDVLEVLSLLELGKEYPEVDYFMTGGISYHREFRGKYETVGELDLIVSKRDDCSVVAIGESKLGVGQLKHAQEQLARFRNYARERICSLKDLDRKSAPLCFL